MAITDLELRMTIKTLAAKGESQRAAARQLALYEGTILYHFWCIVGGTPDGRQSAMHALCWYAIKRVTLIFDKARCCTIDIIEMVALLASQTRGCRDERARL